MSGLLILGAGGHGKVVAEAALAMGKWPNIAFLDDRSDLKEVMGVPIIGSLNSFSKFRESYEYAFVAIGNNTIRTRWFSDVHSSGFTIPVIIHSSAVVSYSSYIGAGTVIMAGSVIQANTQIKNYCIINTSSSVDHDCEIEEGVHLSPGVHIGGEVSIGSYSWIGIGASIINRISIGSNSIIAAGAIVTRDVPSDVMVAGVPAVFKKHLGDERK